MTPPINRLVLGPTASGKSDYAIALAKQEGGHIISADAFQIYKGLDIGTGKVSLSIRQCIPHHLIDGLEPWDSYSVAVFVKQVCTLIEDLNKQGIPVILCGGSGFYVYAFYY